jgi:hypothetical protein
VKADLTGFGAVPGALEITPQTYDFGAVAVGASAPPKTFRVKNPSARAFEVAVRTDLSAFPVVDERCGGGIVAGGEACEVDVGFRPPEPGEHTGALIIRIGALDGGCGGGGVATAALRGTGR